MKNKITILIASVILFVTCLMTSFQINPIANAEDGVFWAFDFNGATEVSKIFSTESYFSTSSVDIVDDALRITNVDTDENSMTDRPTEVTLPTVYSDDYVFEFDMTRRAGDGSVSIRYAMQDSGRGYEFRIHLNQGDPTYGWNYSSGAWTSRKAIEYRKIYSSDVSTDTCNYRFWDFNFYYNEFYIDQTYHVTFLRQDGMNSLYIDGELFFKHKDDNQVYDKDNSRDNVREQDAHGRYTFGALKLRINSTATVDFDNMKVQTISKHLSDEVEALGDTSTWDDQAFLAKEREVKQIYNLYQTYLTEAQRKANDRYDDMVSIYNGYLNVVKPNLTVNWTIANSVAKGTQIELFDKASAEDYWGNKLAVNVDVKFGNKYLLIENGKVKLNESGTYTIIYTAYDRNGNSVSKEYVVTVA